MAIGHSMKIALALSPFLQPVDAVGAVLDGTSPHSSIGMLGCGQRGLLRRKSFYFKLHVCCTLHWQNFQRQNALRV
jgi:hypothetical protein